MLRVRIPSIFEEVLGKAEPVNFGKPVIHLPIEIVGRPLAHIVEQFNHVVQLGHFEAQFVNFLIAQHCQPVRTSQIQFPQQTLKDYLLENTWGRMLTLFSWRVIAFQISNGCELFEDTGANKFNLFPSLS